MLIPPCGGCVLGGCPGRGQETAEGWTAGHRAARLCPGSFHINHTLFASKHFPLCGAAAAGGLFPALFTLPPLPAPHPARLLPLLRPGGFPCCQKINLMLFITEGKMRRSPPALSTVVISAAGHPRRDEGGRGICREGCGRAARLSPAFMSRPRSWGRGKGAGVQGAPVSPYVSTAGARRVSWDQGWQLLVVTPIRDLGTVRGISWIMPGWGWIMPRESHPFSMAVAPPHVHIP